MKFQDIKSIWQGECEPFYFETVSPEDLKNGILQLSGTTLFPGSYVCLSVRNSDFIVRSFQYNNISREMLKGRLQAEAVETLGLPLGDIAFDFQILHMGLDFINGIFVCCPKGLLEEYLSILDEAKLIPVRITSGTVMSLEKFFMSREVDDKRFCLLDFQGEKVISVAVFHGGICELIRKIPFDSVSQATSEIVYSLRSTSAKSHVKQFEEIYAIAAGEQWNDLLDELKSSFDAKPQQISLPEWTKGRGPAKTFFDMNLAKGKLLSLTARKTICQATTGLLAGCVSMAIILGAQIIYKQRSIHSLKSSYTRADYDYALNLKRQIEGVRK